MVLVPSVNPSESRDVIPPVKFPKAPPNVAVESPPIDELLNIRRWLLPFIKTRLG